MKQATTQRISVAVLHGFCLEAMRRCGMRDSDARLIADVLVTTDTWGVHTHGTIALRTYMRLVRAGGLQATATPQIVREGAGWAVVDGRSAVAMVTACLAMRTAIAKAREAGVGYVGVRNSGHFGAAGYYVNLAAEQDLIGLAMTNGSLNMTVPGAKGRVLSCNAFAFAAPTASGRPILLDMALSVVAGGKVVQAESEGRSIPAHWMLDADGHPTTDPSCWWRGGALQPLGAHKGYGLALMVESLAAGLTGGAFARQVNDWVAGDLSQPPGISHAFLAIDVGAVAGAQAFKDRVEQFCEEIRRSPRAEGVERIYVPGEIEWEQRQDALANGIPLPAHVIRSLKQLAEETGVPWEEFVR